MEGNSIAFRGVPLDVTIPSAAGQLYVYNSTTKIFTLVTPLAGTKVYYVSDSSGGAVNRKLTFQDGILVSQT